MFGQDGGNCNKSIRLRNIAIQLLYLKIFQIKTSLSLTDHFKD